MYLKDAGEKSPPGSAAAHGHLWTANVINANKEAWDDSRESLGIPRVQSQITSYGADPCFGGQIQGFLINGVLGSPAFWPMLQKCCVWRPYYDVRSFVFPLAFLPGGMGRTWDRIKDDLCE